MTKYRRSRWITIGLLIGVLNNAGHAFGQSQVAPKEQPQIQDNSFLIEEAYNQERGVVQHINTFSRMWNSKDWGYSFTQEWPAPWNWRHQFSYTLSGMHAGAMGGAGVGDTMLNYRYQMAGNGESRLAFAPRFSVLLPTGDVSMGRGAGSFGAQTNLPLSMVLQRRLVAHWNFGATFIPQARNAEQDRAASAGYNLGQSLIFIAHPRVNFLLEASANNFQSVVGPGRTEWTRVLYLSPGVRWAFNFKNGLQVVPGVAMPIGIGPSAGERGAFVYLSFEHPFGGAAEGRE